jgi:DNA mismatch endonuclease (patch repair protein)
VTDTLTPEQRRRAMQGSVSRGTRPEVFVLDVLLRAGLLARPADLKGVGRLPGDIWVFAEGEDGGAPTALVFVHGCFWHGCPAHYREPATRRSYWVPKIEANRERDRRVLEGVRREFHVYTVWEHDAVPGSKRMKYLVTRLRGAVGGR